MSASRVIWRRLRHRMKRHEWVDEGPKYLLAPEFRNYHCAYPGCTYVCWGSSRGGRYEAHPSA